MNVYLLKNQFIDMLLKKQEFSSAYNGDIKTFYLLDADKDVWNGKGDLQENRFPWIVNHVIDLDHSFDFKIKLKFTISKIQMPPSADVVIRVRADYREILKYVYSTYSLPRVLILKFTGVFTYPESDERVQITDESWSTAMECEFRFSISACFAEKVIMAQKVRLECVTLQLLGEEEPFPRRVIAGAIVETAHINSSANFTQDLTQTNQRELSLSDEGMDAFLGFVNSLQIDTPNINSSVASELLKISHEKEISRLEKVIKDLLMEKPDYWFDFETSLRLYLFCNKLEDYEDLKMKVVKVIRMKRDDMGKSDAFKELLKTDTESAIQLIGCLLSVQ